MFIFLFMTNLFMSDLFITNTKNRPCISPPPPYISPPLYKPIKNRLRKYISPGLIVGGLHFTVYNIWNKNFSHSANEKTEAKMAAVDVSSSEGRKQLLYHFPLS
jgi:hypothetical protein